MSTGRSPLERLSRLRRTQRNWIVDYGLWKVHRLEDKFPRNTQRRLRPLQRDVLDALVAVTGAAPAQVEQAREEFRQFAAQAQPFVGMYAVADSRLMELQYVVTRLVRPRVAVETGVWRGLSSWTMLAAMQRSGEGTLVSIDFPPLEEAQQVQVGHLVPAELRGRWDLRLGPSRQLLPAVLAEYGEIDLFVHDSDHTFFNMSREYAEAWAHLTPHGVLLSDDIDANHAFVRFARRVRRAPVVVAKRERSGYLGLLAGPRVAEADAPSRSVAEVR